MIRDEKEEISEYLSSSILFGDIKEIYGLE